MTSLARVQLFALLAIALAVAACGEGEPATGHGATGAWTRLPDAPLGARESALALWVGGEALVVGGSAGTPCPPGADCVAATDPPLRDGAAFDPVTQQWRTIAAAPVGIGAAAGVVVGGAAYILASDRPAFLRYRSDRDDWERLPLPPRTGQRSVVAAGDRVVAYSGTDESGEVADSVFDPATGEWSELPDDPLPRSFDRTMAWSGRELVLFAHELVPQPGAEKPSLVIAAALDLDSGRWRRLPDSEMLGQGARWFAYGGRLILPALGGADGGDVGNWGRPYPYGGVLDPARGTWSDLPEAPAEVVPDSTVGFSAGIVAGGEADYFGDHGWVLDARASSWIEIPPLGDGQAMVTGRGVVAAGRDLIAFGGVRWDEGSTDGELLQDAWSWSPPR